MMTIDKPRILIVDDDHHVLNALEKLLDRSGYEVVKASSGDEGIRSYREKPTDLIITDIVMPGKDGIQVILELKRDFPAVKIIAISGGGRLKSKECLNEAGRLGAQRTLSKPFSLEDILRAVRDLLNQGTIHET